MWRPDLKFESDAQTRPLLVEQIREALKNRQHVELSGSTMHVRKLLDDLLKTSHGTVFIPPAHEEDYTIRILENVSFPTSDKITVEGVMRQLLREFGWPPVGTLSYVQFYFSKLLKELNADRIVPALLFEYPEVLKQKAFKILEMLGEYTIDRRMVGVPTILCATEQFRMSDNPLYRLSFHVNLGDEGITRGEVLGILEEACPGNSGVFNYMVVDHFKDSVSKTHIQSQARELLALMHKLGLEEVSYELFQQWRKNDVPKVGKNKRYAKTAH